MMSNAPENSHALVNSTKDPHETNIGGSPDLHPDLTWLDKRAAASFVEGRKDLLEAWAADVAHSLTGPDKDWTRLQLVSRSLAVATAQLRTLEDMLGLALERRDARGVDLVTKCTSAALGRLVRLVAEHRAETAVQQRPAVVAVGQACQVNIRTGG
jgi:hypothetical protein